MKVTRPALCDWKNVDKIPPRENSLIQKEKFVVSFRLRSTILDPNWNRDDYGEYIPINDRRFQLLRRSTNVIIP